MTDDIVAKYGGDYGAVWCVFDMDKNHGEKECSDFDNAVHSGLAKGFRIAYSNDSFELWFFLHYFYTDNSNHRSFYYSKLSDQWNCSYERDGKRHKFCRSIYDILYTDPRASQNEAIDRAKKLYENNRHLSYHEQNPVTMVFQLVELLNNNCRK